MSEQLEEVEKIDIFHYIFLCLRALRKLWLPVLLVVSVTAAGYYGYKRFSYDPVYESRATFSVNYEGSKIAGSAGDLPQIKESLPYIVKSDVLINPVRNELGLSSIPGQILLESKTNANMFILRVTSYEGDVSRTICQSVLDHLPEASIYSLGSLQLNILEEPTLSQGPSNAFNKKRSLLVGLFLGLVLGGGLTLLYVMTNRTVEDLDSLKKHLNTEVLTVVPYAQIKKRRRSNDHHIHIKNWAIGTAFTESIFLLRTRVLRDKHMQESGIVLVTSAIPGEGKSTIAANLALSLGELGKTLLVDMDLRNPSIGTVLGFSEDHDGISELLKEICGLSDAIVRQEDLGIDTLSVGRERMEPARVLGGGQLKGMLEQLRKEYQYIVLDTPPAAMLADASATAAYADCAVMVIRQSYARIERIIEGMESIISSGTPVIGTVMNYADNSISSYGYGYRRYHYGYYKKGKRG